MFADLCLLERAGLKGRTARDLRHEQKDVLRAGASICVQPRHALGSRHDVDVVLRKTAAAYRSHSTDGLRLVGFTEILVA